MARRSLRASAQGIQRFKAEMKLKKWTQTYVSGAAQCSRQTVWSLLAGKAIDADIFLQICELLGLQAGAVAEPKDEEASPGKTTDIDALVQQVRETLQPFLKNKFGEMKVLDMSHPIGLGDIYTDVNILQKPTGSHRISQAELLEQCNLEEFERFSFSKLQKKERVSGLHAVEQFPRLVVLGKPGAGKTTFLKRITTQCITGQIFPQQMPVFVTLKQFTEAKQQPDLFNYIAQQWSENGVDNADAVAEKLLNQGRVLLLLDGLDEVRQADSTRVVDDIRRFSERFHRNQFIVTCRIAAKEFTLEPFTEVEIADFDNQQIAVFVTKWFALKDPTKTEHFLQKLKKIPQVQELAKTPLLLTLLCLAFESSGDFPVNRSELYEDGIDVLLKKWDAKRNIERDQVYKKLSFKRKKEMLSQIAWNTFESANYFFKKKDLERQVRNFIVNMTEASTDEQELDLDSEAVLKSIEAQHGLFVERAQGIYSFSHLTFHEYFTAREISIKSNCLLFEDPFLNKAVNHLTNKRWREVFLLITQMLPRADEFIKIIHSKIKFLQSSNSKINYLVNLVFNQYPDIQSFINIKGFDFTSEDQARSCWHIIRSLSFGSVIELVHDVSLLMSFYDSQAEVSPLALKVEFILNSDKYDKYKFNEESYKLATLLDEDLWNANVKIIDSIADLPIFSELKMIFPEGFINGSYRELLRFNPPFSGSETYSKWWEKNKDSWKYDAKNFISSNRKILQNLSFNDDNLIALRQYYYANILLVDCLRLPGISIAPTLKEEIEHDLLLPIFEAGK
jgi:predicted NACHT family NTPase